MELTSCSAGADNNAIMGGHVKFLGAGTVILDILRDILLTLKSIQSHHVSFSDGTTLMKTFSLWWEIKTKISQAQGELRYYSREVRKCVKQGSIGISRDTSALKVIKLGKEEHSHYTSDQNWQSSFYRCHVLCQE